MRAGQLKRDPRRARVRITTIEMTTKEQHDRAALAITTLLALAHRRRASV